MHILYYIIWDLLSTYMYQYVLNTHNESMGRELSSVVYRHNYDKNHFISPLDANLVSLALTWFYLTRLQDAVISPSRKVVILIYT